MDDLAVRLLVVGGGGEKRRSLGSRTARNYLYPLPPDLQIYTVHCDMFQLD